jgi:hypothetical protein
MNTPMANRPGTVGRLSPLMEARLDPVPGIDEGGRLSVRGPNVMLGYLRSENPGVLEPLAGGWHDTGDIVAIDAAGFIAIKGRAKRFAKIAGEMVSLSAVEAMAAALWPQAMSVAVSIPDARKGERIVLLTTQKDAERRRCSARPRPRRVRTGGAGRYPRGRHRAAAGLRQDRLCRRDNACQGARDAGRPVRQQKPSLNRKSHNFARRRGIDDGPSAAREPTSCDICSRS